MYAVPKYIVILFSLITLDYFLGIAIEKQEHVRKRSLLLLVSVCANLGILFFFKYFNFFNENIAEIAKLLHIEYAPFLLNIIIPLGLSFHVFQSLSYVIEVYRRKYTAEKRYINYALYVMFFPQLVAGPIERPSHMLPQFSRNHDFDAYKARLGLERILWGFFKKLVIADQIARIINPYYVHIPSDGPLILAIAVLFAYQIYCDFSGYSDIAIGSALILGYDLSENFNRPFAAKSMAEFWHRWHISLSGWLRDYLYYPLVLGWGKISKMKIYLSTLVTLTLIGLWHGANWTFVIFGLLHGSYLVIEMLLEKQISILKKYAAKLNVLALFRTLQVLLLFTLSMTSLVYFRSSSIHNAWFMLSHITTNFNFDYIKNNLFTQLSHSAGSTIVISAIISIIFMEIIQFFQEKYKTMHIYDMLPKALRFSVYYVLIFSIMMFGYLGSTTFIYFQF